MMLSQIPQSDVVTSEHWSSLKKCLSLSLGDEDDRISVRNDQYTLHIVFHSASAHLS